VAFFRTFVRSAVLASIVLTRRSTDARQLRHWRETDSETLWTVRYTNCDYGFFVLLGRGVVAHDALPPSPNHGFLVSLAEPGTTKYVSWETMDRWIGVDASYDAAEPPVADQFAKKSIQQARPGTFTRWEGLPALRSRRIGDKGKSIDESIVAVRHGIVYQMDLHTTAADRKADELQFERLLRGFRLLPLPLGQCSNG
jgi:hypothetical protein